MCREGTLMSPDDIDNTLALSSVTTVGTACIGYTKCCKSWLHCSLHSEINTITPDQSSAFQRICTITGFHANPAHINVWLTLETSLKFTPTSLNSSTSNVINDRAMKMYSSTEPTEKTISYASAFSSSLKMLFQKSFCLVDLLL